jgi:signal transduction histidine kinase
MPSTIQAKLTWTSAMITSIALLVAGSAFVGYYVYSYRASIARNLIVQANTIALNAVPALRFDDPDSARETLSALSADRNIISAAISRPGGGPFASYTGTDPGGRRVEMNHPIVSEGEQLGTVHLAYSLDELYNDVARYALIAVVVLVLSVLVAMAAGRGIQRSITRPVARLADAAKAVSQQQNYAVRVEPTGSDDELGLLVDTFNEMLARICVREADVEAGNQRYERLTEELEQRVTQRTAELEATNRELEAFTYSVSHDLRAPLRRIDGFAKLLVDEYNAELPDEARHYLGRVRDGARQMGLLVDDLLNLARLGRQDVKLQVAGLSTIVQRVTASLQRDAEGRDIEWQIQPLPFVECDPALIEVVFTNLISNAMKYTRPRARAVIHVGSIEQNGHPVIYVRDNGVGFSMKYADKLFGVFQRLHRAEDFEGTGVGLATVQRILHKHAGTIWAEAELDKGACFYFTLGAVPATRPTVSEQSA